MKIEKVRPSDAGELLGIYAPYVKNTAISFEYEVPTEEEFAERIRTISAKYPYIKAVENGKILGYAYGAAFKGRPAYDWSVETTIYVREDCRNKGVGRILYQSLERSLKNMGILNMNACIAVPSENDPYLTDASQRFHRRMGFSQVGIFHHSGCKFNRWYDMVWMEKMIGAHTTEIEKVKFGVWDIDTGEGL